MFAYLLQLTGPRFVLWCYLFWWLGVAWPYFDPEPSLWLNSLGISAIIGTGLLLSTSYAGVTPVRLGRWAVARLYMMPFFVSSFAALIKGQGFVLVFHPTALGNVAPLAACVAFGCLVLGLRRWRLTRRVVASGAMPKPPERMNDHYGAGAGAEGGAGGATGAGSGTRCAGGVG